MAIKLSDPNAAVSAVDIDHLLTRRPGGSGYKSVYQAKQGTWRVRVRDRGHVKSVEKYYATARDAAKAAVRYYRQRYGPRWKEVVRPGWEVKQEEVPPVLEQFHYRICFRDRQWVLVPCDPTNRYVVVSLIEQSPREWMVTARIHGIMTLVDSPNRDGSFHSPESALIYLGIMLRSDSLFGLKSLIPGSGKRAAMRKRCGVRPIRRADAGSAGPVLFGSPV